MKQKKTILIGMLCMMTLTTTAQSQLYPKHFNLHEVTLTDGALRGLANRGKRLGEYVVQRFAVGMALPEQGRLPAQLDVVHLLELGLKLVDMSGDLPELLELLVGTHGE